MNSFEYTAVSVCFSYTLIRRPSRPSGSCVCTWSGRDWIL